MKFFNWSSLYQDINQKESIDNIQYCTKINLRYIMSLIAASSLMFLNENKVEN